MRPHRLGLPQDRTSEPNWLVRKFRGRIRVLALEAGQDLNQSLARFFPLMRRSASSVGIQARYGTGVSRAGEPAGSLSLADTQKNEALALAEFAAGALHLQSTPPTMTVESSSWCNLRCVMCPHAINAVHRPKHIEPELVQSLEKYIRQAQSIQLHGIGEPFASPAFWYNLSILSDDCHSEVNTNFTLLDEQKLRQLLDSKLQIVNVSLDAARPETYRKIRGYPLESVIGNIRKFIERRQARGQQFPRLNMNMTLMRTNIEEVTEVIDLASSLGADAVFFGHLNHWKPEIIRRYLVGRDHWVFDNAKEGLWNFPVLSNSCLRKAEKLAQEKNIALHFDTNKPMFFEELAVSNA